jgi:hypothetical protein
VPTVHVAASEGISQPPRRDFMPSPEKREPLIFCEGIEAPLDERARRFRLAHLRPRAMSAASRERFAGWRVNPAAWSSDAL